MKTALLYFTCCVITLNTFSQPGTLDQTFNDSGKVHASEPELCYSAALQQDGKILAGGAGLSSGFSRFSIGIKICSCGLADKTFKRKIPIF